MVEIDFDRAGFGAGAAEGGGVGKMFPILQTAQMRSDDGADGTTVGGAVGVAADVTENGADIQAGTAADAMECIALLRIGEEFGAMIIQKDHVPFFGAIGFAGLAWA